MRVLTICILLADGATMPINFMHVAVDDNNDNGCQCRQCSTARDKDQGMVSLPYTTLNVANMILELNHASQKQQIYLTMKIWTCTVFLN